MRINTKNRKLELRGHYKYDDDSKQDGQYFVRGVHRSRMPYPGAIESYSESEMGYQVRGIRAPGQCGAEYHWFTAIRMHVETLLELQAMPKPKLKGI